MADNVNTELGLDVSDLILAVQAAVTSMGAYNKILGDTVEITKQFNSSNTATGATFKAMTDGGQLATVQFKRMKDEAGNFTDQYKILSSTIKTFVPEAERLSRISVAPDLQDSVKKAFNIDPKMFEGSSAAVDKLSFTFQNFVNGALKSNLPFDQLDGLIKKFAADGVSAFDTLTGRELAQVRALYQLQEALAKARGEQEKLQSAQKVQAVQQETTQVVRQKFTIPQSASQDQVNNFNVASIKVGVAASELASAGVPIDQINKAVQDLANGVLVTDDRFLKLAQAMQSVANIDFSNQTRQQENLARAMVESQNIIKNIDGRMRQGLDKPLLGSPEEQVKYRDSLVQVEQELQKILQIKSQASVQKDVIDVMFGKGGTLTGNLPASNAYLDLANAIIKAKNAQQDLGKTQDQAIAKNEELTSSVVRLQQAETIANQSFGGRLNSIKPGAGTVTEINTVVASFARLTPAIAAAGVSEQRALEIINSAINGHVVALKESEIQLHQTATRIQKDFENIGADARRASAAQQQAQNSFAAYYNRTVSLLTNQVIYGAFGELRTGLRDAMDFSRSIAEIGTISQRGGVSLDRFSQGIMSISNATGFARKDVAEGVYQALSNQVTSAANSFSFLNDAAKFARVSQTSLADSVGLLSSVLKSYGLSVSETDKVAGKLFKTIELGRLRAQDIANSFGSVGIIAAEAGVKLDELLAGIAALTVQGVTPANAMTYLRNMISQTIKPTKEMEQFIKKLGFTNGEAALKTLGLAGFLKELKRELDGNVSKTTEFYTNIRSLLAGLNLLGKGTQEFERDLAAITNASTAYNNAAQIMADSSFSKLTIAINNLQNDFKSMTDGIINNTALLIETLGGLKNAIVVTGEAFALWNMTRIVSSIDKTLIPALLNIVSVLSVDIVAALAKAGSALYNLPTTLISVFSGTGPALFATVGTGLAAITAAVAIAFTTWKALENKYVNAQMTALDSLNARRKGWFQARLDQSQDYWDKELNLMQRFVQGFQAGLNKLEDKVVADYAKMFGYMEKTFERVTGTMTEEISKQKAEINKIDNYREASSDRVATTVAKVEDRIFEQSIKNLTLRSEIEARAGQANVDLVKAKEAAEKNNEKAMNRYLDSFDKQMEKIEQAQQKLRSLNDEYDAHVRSQLAKSVEWADRLTDAATKRAVDFFKDINTALKDLNDKTGDVSGLARKTVRDMQNALRATKNGEINWRIKTNVDPEMLKILARLDPKVRRELKYAISIGNTEKFDRYAKKVEDQLKKEGDLKKAQTAFDAGMTALGRSDNAVKANDFESARKFLFEAEGFFSKAEGAITVNDIVGIQKDLEDKITKTFEDQINKQGTINKQREEALKAQYQLVDTEKAMNDALTKRNELEQKLLDAKMIERAEREKDLADLTATRASWESLKNAANDVKTLKEEKGITPEVAIAKLKELQKAAGDAKFTRFFETAEFGRFNTQIDNMISKLEQEKEIQDRTKELQKVNQEQERRNKLQKDFLGGLQEEINLTSDEMASAQKSVVGWSKGTARTLAALLALPSNILTLGNYNTWRDSNKNIKDFKEQVANAEIKLQDFKSISDKVKEGQLTGKAPVFTPEEQDIIETVLNKLVATNKEFENLDLSQIFAPALSSESELYQKYEALRKSVETPMTMDLNTQPINNKLDDIVNKIRNLGSLAQQYGLTELIPGEPLPVPQQPPIAPKGFATGGLVTGQPGVDKVFMRATAGEFVMNEKSTRMFYNQLGMMNRGVDPSSNTVNMGGINITLNGSGNSEVDARNLAKVLRRMVKRGQIALN